MQVRKSPGGDAKRTWEPMVLTYAGRVSDMVQGGGGKLSIASDDPGEEFRKPSGLDK